MVSDVVRGKVVGVSVGVSVLVVFEKIWRLMCLGK